MENILKLWKKSKNLLISGYFGAGFTHCHPRLYSRRPSLSCNSVPLTQWHLHIRFQQPHYRNIKQTFPHISYSYLSGSDYSRFSLSRVIFIRWYNCLLSSTSFNIVWKIANILTQSFKLHRMKIWICAMTFYSLSHRIFWQDTHEPVTGFDHCGLSRLSHHANVPSGCST